ncbi:MAG: efflux RND transporter periplasmic adaptor subunit [Syntrophobacter sp.]
MHLYKPIRNRCGRPVLAAWVIAIAMLPLLAGCESRSAPASPPPPKVTVKPPVRQNVVDYLDLTGTTQAVNTAQLRARVEGYLEKILFKDGEIVRKDQQLFLIQQNTYQARLQQAEGNAMTQRARLDHAKNELTRFTNLFNQKAAAQTDVENWRFERDSAQASLVAAEAQRDLAKLDLAYTMVTAPFGGRIDRRLVDPGNLVGSGGSTVLAEISQIDPLYVYVNVSESELPRLMQHAGNTNGQGKQGPPVYIGFTEEQGYPHEGYLDFTSTNVSPTTGTLLVRGVLKNKEGKMLPGQFARIRIPVGEERTALFVPEVALAYDQLGDYVLVVNGDGVVERRNVKKGSSRDGLLAIEKGLTDNEQVIVNGILRAAPGRRVTPEREIASDQPGALSLNER